MIVFPKPKIDTWTSNKQAIAEINKYKDYPNYLKDVPTTAKDIHFQKLDFSHDNDIFKNITFSKSFNVNLNGSNGHLNELSKFGSSIKAKIKPYDDGLNLNTVSSKYIIAIKNKVDNLNFMPKPKIPKSEYELTALNFAPKSIKENIELKNLSEIYADEMLKKHKDKKGKNIYMYDGEEDEHVNKEDGKTSSQIQIRSAHKYKDINLNEYLSNEKEMFNIYENFEQYQNKDAVDNVNKSRAIKKLMQNKNKSKIIKESIQMERDRKDYSDKKQADIDNDIIQKIREDEFDENLNQIDLHKQKHRHYDDETNKHSLKRGLNKLKQNKKANEKEKEDKIQVINELQQQIKKKKKEFQLERGTEMSNNMLEESLLKQGFNKLKSNSTERAKEQSKEQANKVIQDGLNQLDYLEKQHSLKQGFNKFKSNNEMIKKFESIVPDNIFDYGSARKRLQEAQINLRKNISAVKEYNDMLTELKQLDLEINQERENLDKGIKLFGDIEAEVVQEAEPVQVVAKVDKRRKVITPETIKADEFLQIAKDAKIKYKDLIDKRNQARKEYLKTGTISDLQKMNYLNKDIFKIFLNDNYGGNLAEFQRQYNDASIFLNNPNNVNITATVKKQLNTFLSFIKETQTAPFVKDTKVAKIEPKLQNLHKHYEMDKFLKFKQPKLTVPKSIYKANKAQSIQDILFADKEKGLSNSLVKYASR